MHVAKRMTQNVSNIKVLNPQPAVIKSAKRGISNGLMTMNRQKADLRLVTLKQTIVAILMARLMELGATQWTKIYVGSIVVFLHVKPKALAKKGGAESPAQKLLLVQFVPPTEKHIIADVALNSPNVQQSLTTSPSL